MPHLKAILAAYLPEAQRLLLREIDSAIVDFEQHQQQLFDKLVSILDEKRLATHMPTLAPALVPSADRARAPRRRRARRRWRRTSPRCTG